MDWTAPRGLETGATRFIMAKSWIRRTNIQAYIEYYGTKTGIINEKISATNRGNKIYSFDIDNTTRDRHQSFTENRENKIKEFTTVQ
ncbi:hypothetical protein [Alistipes sp.]|uniref:hypothetical protein n=1 Tax=Alistipes sp. TaxID=1872444 RepID=UPI0025BCA052|nr:hypothetical protein [Alistipes sp.]